MDFPFEFRLRRTVEVLDAAAPCRCPRRDDDDDDDTAGVGCGADRRGTSSAGS
eukprot:m.4641 g.4641  ORF g.4641 m.4641 type:complete len:53 (-) comp2060_c0_seq1:266-424(-)